MATRRRSALKASSSASLVTSTSPAKCTSPPAVQSSANQQRSSELPNIFSQMDEFSKKDSPAKPAVSNESSNVGSACNSPKRLRSSGSASALSETLISNLHSVLSLPSSVRQTATGGANSTVADKSSNDASHNSGTTVHCNSNLDDVDNNKNCIPRSSCSALDVSLQVEEVPSKKTKLTESCDNNEISLENIKQQYSIDRLTDMRILTVAYDELLTELFFLQNGGNLMDYFSWQKRPNTLLACYLCSERLESDPDLISVGIDCKY
jgi:hypothetical protein